MRGVIKLFFKVRQPPVGLSHIIEVSRSYTDTPHSVELLWTSDKPDAETSTRQHTTLTRDKAPMPSEGFELAIPSREWPQTHALDHAATGIDFVLQNPHQILTG